MIHEYRKVLLRDPGLPKPLLPARWPGHQAQQLSGALYHHILSASERYVDHHFANQNGPLPPPDNAFYLRFSPQK